MGEKSAKQAHIRAARDWLGRAEDSLGRDDDVQGDLKLMLAKAELARTEPGKGLRRLHALGLRLGALAVALALAGGGIYLGRGETPVEIPPAAEADGLPASFPLPEKTAAEAGSAMSQALQEAPSQQPAGNSAAEGAAATLPAPRAADVQASTPLDTYGTAEAGTPQSAAAPMMTYSSPRVPDADKQQLMQAAGEVLRK